MFGEWGGFRGGSWVVIGCECIGGLAARPTGKEKCFLSFNVPRYMELFFGCFRSKYAIFYIAKPHKLHKIAILRTFFKKVLTYAVGMVL